MQKLRQFLFKNTSAKQTLAKNTFWIFISELLGRVLKLALVIYAARSLGTAGWGSFSYALSLGSLIMIFSDIGLNGIITREAVQKRESYTSFISTAIIIKLLLVIFSTAAVILLGPSLAHIESARILMPLIALTLFFDIIRDFFLYINTAFEKMERDLLVKALVGVVTLGLGILLITRSNTPHSIAVAYALGSGIGCIGAIILIYKDIVSIIGKIDKKLIQKVVRTTLPFAIISLITSIMANTDIYLLGIWKTPETIGIYASAQRVYQFILLIPVTVATALFPIQSRLATHKHAEFASVLGKTTAAMCMIALPLSIGGIILSNSLVTFVFGGAYSEAAHILQILLVMLIAAFPLVLFSNSIIAYNKQSRLAVIYTLGVIANALTNILLIPTYGAVGSAIATLISTTLITSFVWRELHIMTKFIVWSRLRKSLGAVTGMILVLLLAKYLDVSLVMSLILGSSVYVGLLIYLKEPLLLEIVGAVKQKMIS